MKKTILLMLISYVCFGFVINVKAQLENRKGCGKTEDDKCFHTGLTFAARTGDAEKVKALLAEGAAVNERNYFKRTALKEAIITNRREIVKILIDAGANVNDEAEDWTPLGMALVSSSEEIFNDLTIAEADYTRRFSNGKTLLIAAAGIGREKIIETLLFLREDINAVDNAGRNALMSAILDSLPPNVSCVKYLIERGININTKDKEGLTALDYAKSEMKRHRENKEAKEAFLSIIKTLREAGASENKN